CQISTCDMVRYSGVGRRTRKAPATVASAEPPHLGSIPPPRDPTVSRAGAPLTVLSKANRGPASIAGTLPDCRDHRPFWGSPGRPVLSAAILPNSLSFFSFSLFLFWSAQHF